jgi:serine/threonine protein kinase
MQPGDRVGNYIIIEQIGQGGQAAVWSAEDESLKRTVAVKTIDLTAPVLSNTGSSGANNSATLAADEQAQRFRSEAKTIAELEHPFILPIYNFGQKDQYLYIIMRYMPGGTLRRLINKGRMDLATVIKLGEPLADALDLAHERRIVHRDIKSVNILLDAQNRPYLADFGLSVTAGDPSAQSGSGTLSYMSPEQLRNEMVDHSSDLYSFGMLLYEMFAGEVPKVGTMHWNLAQVTQGAALPNIPGLPREVMEVLRRALHIDKKMRYETAGLLLAALRATQPSNAPVADDDDDGLISLLPISDPAAQAAQDAYDMLEVALDKWADGAGRFRLYEEDYKLIDSFLTVPEAQTGFEISEAAKRLMLRGAFEHQHNIDFWWKSLPDLAERRAIALQTLMSEIPDARRLALSMLSTLPDANPPAIPIRVAAILRKEPEPDVRLAGVRLLASHGKPNSEAEAKKWRDTAYSHAIDTLLATLAASDASAQVRAAAAEAISNIRSETGALALGKLAGEFSASQQPQQAFQALLSIRDAAGTLPGRVPAGLRGRIFTRLSLKQFFAPGLWGRWLAAGFAFVVGFAPIAAFQFGIAQNREREINTAIGNAVAVGIQYGLLIGFAIMISMALAGRLRAWQPIGRLVLAILVGGGLANISFLIMRRFYYFDTEPVDSWPWHLGTTHLFVAGFVVGAALVKQLWLRVLLANVGVFAALHSSWLAVERADIYTPLIFFETEFANQPFIFCLWMAAVIGLLAHLPEFNKRQA